MRTITLGILALLFCAETWSRVQNIPATQPPVPRSNSNRLTTASPTGRLSVGVSPRHPLNEPVEGNAGITGLSGRWWVGTATANRLGITPAQQRDMDRLFRHARLKLIDLSAILEKEEVTLAALLAASRPEEAKVLPLFDRVAEARAELEKANARLLLQVILVLTPEQWIMLQSR